jgi:nicotinamide-nucleotide amidase
VLENPTGTAPGLRLQIEGSEFFFLPGPPVECRPIFEKDILPLLKKTLQGRRLARRESWRTFGRGESDVYQRVAPVIAALEKDFPEAIRFGVHISFPCIDLTLEHWRAPGAKNPSPATLDAACAEISRALGNLCFSRERETMAAAVFRLLRERKLRIAAAESCTGGLFSQLLTDLPGSSEVFLGGVVSYANEAKESLLGVKKSTLAAHGAVSEQTAIEMCSGARERFGADYAISITGIAGPGGGSAEKPVGTTFVGISSAKGSRATPHLILSSKGNREQNRMVAAHLAFDALRMEILDLQ